MNVTITLPPALGPVIVTLPDGSVLPATAAPERPPIVIRPPGLPASAELLPAHGTYPASTLLARVNALVDRKAELTDTVVPDLVLWFDNQIL
ncbi:hypothetical protein [Deinococcus sp. QL22]|uniref:hypothetical protein n=1 Tax=Deinococcus sp. QL22 TaxID=2939437 RepID=UPI00201764A9|nr:hypothetical protein [Deinococcus sp. QL22]UQN06272.1 hypothetical protein M1R55_15650 [Deinococcus sp. QL22]